LQPGTIKTITVTPLNPSDPAKNGWARIEYQIGNIYGVSTYKYRPAGTLTTLVGVLSSPLIGYGTIPIDNNDSQARYTGFALANPNTDSVNVRLITLDQSGNVADDIFPPQLNPLGPNRQVAVFLHQLVPRSTFKGTLILYVTDARADVVERTGVPPSIGSGSAAAGESRLWAVGWGSDRDQANADVSDPEADG